MATLATINRRYSDIRTNLDKHPVSGDLLLSADALAVKTAVRNLLLTGKYERRFRPYIGSGLQKYLFELVTPVTAQLIRESIIETITNFEPRARLIDVTVEVDPDSNKYNARVVFGITNLADVVTLDEIIERIR